MIFVLFMLAKVTLNKIVEVIQTPPKEIDIMQTPIPTPNYVTEGKG